MSVIPNSVPSEQQSLSKFRALTKTDLGARWLEQALDPFHDRQVTPTGMPDAIKGASVVKCIRKSFTVTAPSTVKWDALVTLTSEIHNFRGAQATVTYNEPDIAGLGAGLAVGGMANAIGNVGGCMCTTGAVGADLNWYSAASTQAGAVWPLFEGSDPLTQGSSFPRGGFRLVGAGFEIVDTTPELYRSGILTAFRQTEEVEQTQVHYTNTTPTAVNICTTDIVQASPASMAIAKNMPGSASWRMSDGVYMVQPMNTEVGLVRPRYGQRLELNRADASGTQTAGGLFPIGGATFITTGMGNWYCPAKVPKIGAYLSGLDPNVSFTVEARWFVEIFPDPSSDLITLASSSPVEDEAALDAYKVIIASLPIACPKADNDAGDFLRRAMKTAESVRKNFATFMSNSKPIRPLVYAGLATVPKVGPALAKGLITADAAYQTVDAIRQSQKKARSKKKPSSVQAIYYRPGVDAIMPS
jgi:hypothetical protein